MELNKIASEITNEYVAHELELKDGDTKFPPASRRLAQTIFPTDGCAGLLEGCSTWVAACAAAAGGSGDPQLSAPPTVGPSGGCWGRGGGAVMRKEISFESAWRCDALVW